MDPGSDVTNPIIVCNDAAQLANFMSSSDQLTVQFLDDSVKQDLSQLVYVVPDGANGIGNNIIHLGPQNIAQSTQSPSGVNTQVISAPDVIPQISSQNITELFQDVGHGSSKDNSADLTLSSSCPEDIEISGIDSLSESSTHSTVDGGITKVKEENVLGTVLKTEDGSQGSVYSTAGEWPATLEVKSEIKTEIKPEIKIEIKSEFPVEDDKKLQTMKPVLVLSDIFAETGIKDMPADNWEPSNKNKYKKFSCPWCKFNPLTLTLFCNHLIADHCMKSISDGYIYSCEFCPGRFSNTADYNKHLILAKGHEGAIHICSSRMKNDSVCEKAFGDRDLLLRHELDVHGKLLPELKYCDQCPALFKGQRGFNNHVNSHKMDVHCPVCSMVSVGASPLQLLAHVWTHMGRGMEQCSRCQCIFLTKYDSMQHVCTSDSPKSPTLMKEVR